MQKLKKVTAKYINENWNPCYDASDQLGGAEKPSDIISILRIKEAKLDARIWAFMQPEMCGYDFKVKALSFLANLGDVNDHKKDIIIEIAELARSCDVKIREENLNKLRFHAYASFESNLVSEDVVVEGLVALINEALAKDEFYDKE